MVILTFRILKEEVDEVSPSSELDYKVETDSTDDSSDCDGNPDENFAQPSYSPFYV